MNDNEQSKHSESEDLNALWQLHAWAETLAGSSDESMGLIGQRIRVITLQAIRAQDPWSTP